MTHPLRLAITGGTGFVGRAVIQAALAEGYHVRALVRRPQGRNLPTHPNLDWYAGALGEDDQTFVEGTDHLIHIAGLIKARNRSVFDAVNVDAARNLATVAQAAGVKRLILLSSMAAREPHLSDYAASKAAGEMAVRQAYDGPLAIIRAPAVFGPGDEATKPFFQALKKGFLPVPGGRGWRKRRLSMVYAPDLARDIVTQAVTGTYDGLTVSPATMGDMSWPDFAALCEAAFERPIRLLSLPTLLLWPVAGATSISSRLFGIGHLTLGKLREFQHADWSSGELIQTATAPKDALKATLRAYESDQKGKL